MARFGKAIKLEAKGRVALIGPAGSGKSYTALTLARALAGPEGTIAASDTEHGSLSKYADQFAFDVEEIASFSPQVFLDSLSDAIKAGYSVYVCDSLSHFWMGKDGALEFVDNAKKRSSSRDDMAGWKDFSPIERKMVDAMLAAPLHVIVTMRTKTDYQEVEYTKANGQAGKKRVKIGLAPVQRQGLEYEFDLIGYMDEDNTLIVDKSRCGALTSKALARPGQADFKPFVDWLEGVKLPGKEESLAEWREFLGNTPRRELLNQKLPDIGKLRNGTKKAVIGMVSDHARERGWIFHKASSSYIEQPQPETNGVPAGVGMDEEPF